MLTLVVATRNKTVQHCFTHGAPTRSTCWACFVPRPTCLLIERFIDVLLLVPLTTVQPDTNSGISMLVLTRRKDLLLMTLQYRRYTLFRITRKLFGMRCPYLKPMLFLRHHRRCIMQTAPHPHSTLPSHMRATTIDVTAKQQHPKAFLTYHPPPSPPRDKSIIFQHRSRDQHRNIPTP